MTDPRAEVVREILIAARPQTVFSFLVEPVQLLQWIGHECRLEAVPGGVFRLDFGNGSVALGTYREVIPPRRVVFTWGWEGADAAAGPGTSLVAIDLAPEGNGTRLRLRHSGLPPTHAHFSAEHHRERWAQYLDRLARLASDQVH